MSSKLSKSDKTKSKFTQLNINHVYKGNTTETHHKPAVRQYGMQVVGKLQGTRRLPPPAWVPSLKAETGGLDPRVALVPPGGSGWGATAYPGITPNDADPAQVSNDLPPTLDSLANSTTYTSMNGTVARETIGTSFEPAFARHNFATAPKMTTESVFGAEPMSKLFSGQPSYAVHAGTTMAKSDGVKVSAAAEMKRDSPEAVGVSSPMVPTTTTEAPTSAWSQRSQATIASGGLAANKPFFQRPAPVITAPAAVTSCEKISVESSAIAGNVGVRSVVGKATEWASVAKEEEPNFDEHILFSDEEEGTQEESRDTTINQPSKLPAQEVFQGRDNSLAVNSTEASTWARCSSNMADSCGISTDPRLFPPVSLDAWSTSDPNKLMDNMRCSSVPRHLPFGIPPTSVAGMPIDRDGGRIPQDSQYLPNTSSAHVSASYKDPYFPQMVPPRLMDRSITNRLAETTLLSGETETELQNVQRLARTQEFKSAVERAQQARAARNKTDVFISDQNIQYCQSVPLHLQSTTTMGSRESAPNVTPLLNSSAAPHMLLSAYQQVAATGNVLPDLATVMANAAMALTGGTSTPSRFPGSVPFVAPTAAPLTSISSCTSTGAWPSPLTPAIVSAATAAGLLNSRTHHGRLDNFPANAGSAGGASQISTPASHPPAIILNPDFFMERFLEIINQQQQQKSHAPQITEPLNKIIPDAVPGISRPSGVSMSDDMLRSSQQHKCNGSSALNDYGFRADHFASTCIEDAQFGTTSPDLLSSDVVRTGPQPDSDKSSSKLNKRVPGLMDVKVPKSTTCNLAHIWDQDDYLSSSGSRIVGSRGRGRPMTSEKGRGILNRRRGGTLRSGDSVTTATQAHSTQPSHATTKLVSGEFTSEGQGESETVPTSDTLDNRLPTQCSDSSGDDNVFNGPGFAKTNTSSQRTFDARNIGDAHTDTTGDGRLASGASRRYRGRGESQYYGHDVDYNNYDHRYARGRAAHRAASRGGSSSHFTHHSFNSRDTAGNYSTRYIRQFGGGSFSSRGYRQHTSGTDQQPVSKSGSAAHGGHKDVRPLRSEPPTTSKHSDVSDATLHRGQSDRPRRPFTHQRAQTLRDEATGNTEYHYSDNEEPSYYHRRNRDHQVFISEPSRNRSHERPRHGSLKNTSRKQTTQASEGGDPSELSRREEVTAPPRGTRSDTAEMPIVDYEDSDVPTVRVPAPEPKLSSNYRQQYTYSHGGNNFRPGNYNQRHGSGNTGPTGHRSSNDRANSQQQTQAKRAGATGNFQSARRYRELRDRHRDDGRDGDGGGAAAGGGSRTATSNTNTNGSSATGGSGGGGRSGTTAPSGGGVGGSRDVDAFELAATGEEEEGDVNWLTADANVDASTISSNENNASQSAGVPDGGRRGTAVGHSQISAGNRSFRSSNYAGGSQVNRRHILGHETSQNYRQPYAAPQKRNQLVYRSQNIPPLMSIKPTGPFARSPDRFDAVLNAGCCESSTFVSVPSLDTVSVKSDEFSGTNAEGTSSSARKTTHGAKNDNNGDDCENDESSFLSDGFTEVVSKAGKRLARLRLQQEAAAAVANNSKSSTSRRHQDESQKQQSNRLPSRNSIKSVNGQHQRRRECSPVAVKSPSLKSKSMINNTVLNKYTMQRNNKLLRIKPTFMGPSLSSVSSDNPSGLIKEENHVDHAPIQVNASHHSSWVNVGQSVPSTSRCEPRTWSKVVGTKSISTTAASLSSERKQLTSATHEQIDSSSSLKNQAAASPCCNNRPIRNAPTCSVIDDATDIQTASKTSKAMTSHELIDCDTVTHRVERVKMEPAVVDKRQICTVSATSVYPSVTTATLSNPVDNVGIISNSINTTVSCNPTVSSTVPSNPVVVVVPVSSNNICKVRPQQQQTQRSPIQSGVSVSSTGVPLVSQLSPTSNVTSISVGETNITAASMATDSVCHDMDRDYHVDLSLTLSGGGTSSTAVAALHDRTVRPSWPADGARPSLFANSSTTAAAYYNKFAGAHQTAEVNARSFWPSEQQPQIGDLMQHMSGREVSTQNSQYAVHQPHPSLPDHAALGLLPTGVADFAGNKANSMSSVRHNLYTLQANYTAQSLAAPAMESYNSSAAPYAAAGSGSTFTDFTCKLPPSHLGSPTQQQHHPTLGSNSLYIAPSLLHSSTAMGGPSQQQTLSSYPATTASWTTMPMNSAHPPQQQALLHPTQQRLRHHRPTHHNAALESPAPFNGFSFHPDPQSDYTYLQPGVQPSPSSGLYSTLQAHPHSTYVPPTSRSWSLLGAPTGSVGGSVIAGQDYHHHPGIAAVGAPSSGANAGIGTLGGSGAGGLLPHPIPHTGGGGRSSNDYASFVAPHVVSSAGNVGFNSSLVNNYVGVIGGGRPTVSASAGLAPQGDHLNMSLRHRGGQPGFYAPLHAGGGSVVGGLTDSPSSLHNSQMAASQQHFPVHSTFYTSSAQQHQSLQQQLSQFAAGNQSAAVARATGNHPVPHPHHHGLVGGPQAAATGLYAAFGTPPPNQPTPPPLSTHPGPAPIAPTALRHHVEGWHWWG